MADYDDAIDASEPHTLSIMLPEPSLTFTLPSLHDGLPLNCRVYHPQSLSASPTAPPWKKHAAIVAHPYAPLGGCYDDPIVHLVASTLLRLGFLVVTFNFRGARGSTGGTSWTAKAERADYMSISGFLSYYVHYLDPFPPFIPVLPRGGAGRPEAEADIDELAPSTIRVQPPTPDTSGLPPPISSQPVLLFAGYSYGALITTQLPAIGTILTPFESPTCGTPAAEIRLRAQHLAETENTILASARAAAVDRQSPRSPRKSLNMRVGWDEDNRKSHDSHRPFSVDLEDKIRNGVAELMKKTKKGHQRRLASGSSNAPQDKESPMEHLLPVPDLTTYRPAYLLVSPLQGAIRNLATLSMPSSLSKISSGFWSRPAPRPAADTKEGAAAPPTHMAEAEEKLVLNPTLAFYGDKDVFVPVRKLNAWADRLSFPKSQFRANKVSGAGHFWLQGPEAEAMAHLLRDAVRAFGRSLVSEG